MARQSLTGKWIRIEGIDEMQKRIAKIQTISDAKRFKERVLMPPALAVRDKARSNAPFLTGRLRGAIFAAYGTPSKPSVLVGVSYKGEKGAPYAHLVEFGHENASASGHTISGGGRTRKLSVFSGKRTPARPYFRPAITSTRPLVAKMVADGMRGMIEEAAK